VAGYWPLEEQAMAQNKGEALLPFVDADPGVVYAFERGAAFGIKQVMEAIRSETLPETFKANGDPMCSDLWTINEWRSELKKIVDWNKQMVTADRQSHAFAEGRWIYDIWCNIGKPKEGVRIDGVLYTVERCEALAHATELRGLTKKAGK
jgi:hypothetical protein